MAFKNRIFSAWKFSQSRTHTHFFKYMYVCIYLWRRWKTLRYVCMNIGTLGVYIFCISYMYNTIFFFNFFSLIRRHFIYFSVCSFIFRATVSVLTVIACLKLYTYKFVYIIYMYISLNVFCIYYIYIYISLNAFSSASDVSCEKKNLWKY